MIIGIVTAVEIHAALKKYSDRLIKEEVTGFDVYSLEINNGKIYIVQSGAGEIRAAASTQMLITKYSVEVIINYGVVGALRDKLNSLKTCVVEKVIHYDMDTSAADNCEVGRYLDYEDIYLRTSPELVQKVLKLNEKLKTVTCASADKFVADDESKRELADRFNADICDMESAAIVLVCDQNKVPNLLIKTIADSIHGGVEEFGKYMEEASDICLDVADSMRKIMTSY